MYKNMTEILHGGKVGNFELSHFVIGENNLYAMFHGIPCGKFVRLTHKGEVVMSDTDMEKRTNANFVRNAHGKVLVGGLGIGLILLAIQDKTEVEKIVVVEKYKEVIDIVKDQLQLNEKVEVVNADVWEYVPAEKFNTIYMDIWNFINTDVYRDSMKPLIAKYRKFLVSKQEDSNRFIDCWCKKQAKNGEQI